MENIVKKQHAIITTQAPIHYEVLAPTGFLLMGFDMEDVGRSLMYHHAIEDVLDIDLDEIFSGVSTMDSVYVESLLEHGTWDFLECLGRGKRIPAAALETLRKDFPTFDLLPSDLFHGTADIGDVAFCTQESAPFYGKNATGHPSAPSQNMTECLPHFEDMVFEAKRTGFYPVGTSLYWNGALSETPFEGTALAFDAFFALIARYAEWGTFDQNEYHIAIHLDDLDTEKAIQKYDQYLLDNKQNIIDGMHLVIELVTYR